MENRRRLDRRNSLMAIRLPDRRRGFPRRTVEGTVRRSYYGMLKSLRDNPTAIVLLGALLLALNLADLVLTQRALNAGAVELNPVMAALFESGFSTASAFKLAMGAAIVGGLWSLRRYRPAVAALVWVTVGMGFVVVYQTAFVAALI